MTQVNKIVFVARMGLGGASTDGWVYLGIGGREFLLDTDANDFQAGLERFVFGEESNVKNADRNDPRTGWPISLEECLRHPPYIRFQGNDREDDLGLRDAAVLVYTDDLNNAAAADVTPYYGENLDCRLGTRFGNIREMGGLNVQQPQLRRMVTQITESLNALADPV